MDSGPNFFIWVAMGVVVASTIAGLNGHDWVMWIGFPLAIALAVFNKVRAVRRRRAELNREFD